MSRLSLSDFTTCRSAPRQLLVSLATTLAALCLFAGAGRTAEAQRAMSQYVRDEWTADRSFPGGPVHAITQTADSYLWIGAEKGLVRFDGLTFRLLEPKGAPPDGPTVLGVVAEIGRASCRERV